MTIDKKMEEELLKILKSRIESGEEKPLTDKQRATLQEISDVAKHKGEWRKAFAKNGHRFGTVTETWEALRGISKSRKLGQYPDIDTLNWLASGIDRCKKNDPAQLLRELGLLIHGRHRSVNPDLVADRVNELIKSGSSIMQAAEQAASEIGCSVHAAYRWHRQVYKVKTDGRRK
jgi:hypothetical protein